MPIYDCDMPKADMEAAARNGATCGQCDGRLTVAFGGFFGYQGWILRCRKLEHNTIKAKGKPSEKEQVVINMYKGKTMQGAELTKMTENQMIGRINQARFPQELSPDHKKMLAGIAIEYGLDPLMGELVIYQGKPYITMDGRLRKAQETEKYDGVHVEVATAEQKVAMGYKAEDFVWRADVYRIGASHAFEGWGYVTQKEMSMNTNPHLPIVKNPSQHAQKRAIVKALRMAFHVPLPSFEDADYENGSTPAAPAAEQPKVTVEKPPAATSASKKAETPKQATTTPPKAERASSAEQKPPDWIPENIGELYSFAQSHGKKYTPTWVQDLLKIPHEEIAGDLDSAIKDVRAITGW